MDLLLETSKGGKLYLGNSHDARDEVGLRKEGITAIVNVAKDLNDPFYPSIKYYKAGLDDGASNTVMDYVRAAQIVISLVLQSDESVLLHCHEGRSRTAAIAIVSCGVFDLAESGLEFGPGITWKNRLAELLAKANSSVVKVRPLCEKMNEEHRPFCAGAILSLIRMYFVAVETPEAGGKDIDGKK